MKIFLSILAVLFCTSALAADLPTKASAYVGYPTTNGFYYGIGTGGNAGAVSGGAIGTQIVQGEIDAIIGYTGKFAGNAFWFAEMQGGFSNLNGSSNGLCRCCRQALQHHPAICTCSPASLSKISASSLPRLRVTTGSYPHLSARAF